MIPAMSQKFARSIAAAAFVTLASTTAHAADWRVSTAGYGPARPGMSAAELGRALGVEVAPPAAADEPLCYYAATEPELPGIVIMMSDGRVARFDVDAPDVVTKSGFGVGTTEAQILEALGADAVEVTPHKYTGPEGHYLTVWTDDRTAAVRFETDGAKVTRFYAGRVPEVTYVEGCS